MNTTIIYNFNNNKDIFKETKFPRIAQNIHAL